ncbi:putative inorganic phosphate cotransporter [Penaeus japonicus]|uniref:putative inorganic phosphate cotransporter n=1 Tax=Penaeus japonicus TaxID=27405 RepID=UPI001C715764|nr:putative inorganic phosphate cotransporter [Penaeus japonicus]
MKRIQNGAVSAIPFLLRYVGALTWGFLGDWLIKKGHLSITTCRKIFSVIGTAVGTCNNDHRSSKFWLADWKAILSLICLALFFNGAVTASILVNHTDIAPNFSGTLFGIANTFCSFGGFTVPMVVGYMTNREQTSAQWQKVFVVFISVYFVTEIFYLVFSSGDVQPWNNEAAGKQEEEEAERSQLNEPKENETINN